LVHGRGADLADEVAHHEQVNPLLFVFNIIDSDVFEVQVSFIVLVQLDFVPVFDVAVDV
jgi:hypothetical protein